MRKGLLGLLFAVVVIGLPLAVLGQVTEPQTPQDAMNMLPLLMDAFKAKNWSMVASMLVMLLVYGFRMIVMPKLNMDHEKLALVSASLAVLVAMAVNLSLGQPWLSALLGGLFIGAAASGFWSMLFKHVLPKPKSEQPPAQ